MWSPGGFWSMSFNNQKDLARLVGNFPTPVQSFRIGRRDYLVKRDDLSGEKINGNKARKLRFLYGQKLPEAIYSWGGSQSNAMLALARFCEGKVRFHYYLRRLPPWLAKTPIGNYRLALESGMEVHLTGDRDPGVAAADARENFTGSGGHALLIPMGVADPRAEPGIGELARELLTEFGENPPVIFLSAGTGTTAVYLRRNLPPSFEVWTVPTAGDRSYLEKEMVRIAGPGPLPRILEYSQKVPFADPRPEFLHAWELCRDAGLPIDLLYDAKLWATLLENPDLFRDRQILVIHQGGLEGNSTQFSRYSRCGFRLPPV